MQILRPNSLLQFLLSAIGLVCFSGKATFAQIVPDDTLNTQVDSNGNVTEITGGQTRGDNLFHSFQDFSVQTGNEAFFNNAENISNIFSRVTGNSISNIDGLMRANGSASLFLINPNGIIFGENAQLDIGGSFLSSTADSIVFAEVEFSAINIDTPPLLTINAPIGLNLGNSPGSIVNRSTIEDVEANPVGLEVLAGNNLSLVGGEIVFEGGNATARGGDIELGGLSAAGTVSINEDGSLTIPDGIAKADITLRNGARVDVMGAGEGNIAIDGRNLELTADSVLNAGINQDSPSNNARTGDITIDLTDNLNLNQSRIMNLVEEDGVGNSGNVSITAGSVEVTNGGEIDASTEGKGNAGLIEITATGDLTFDGATSEGDRSGVTSQVNLDGEGNAGGVNIFTTNLILTNGGRIDSSTEGKGDAGSVNIIATGDLTFDGATSEGDRSEITNQVRAGGVGNAEGVNVSTTNLTLTNGGRIRVSTKGKGDAGLVNIIATGDLTFDGATSEGDRSEATSRVDSDGEGNAEGVNISTTNLTLINGGRIDASTSGLGNAGSVNITATGDLIFNGTTLEGDRSGVTSRVNRDGRGNTGDITITTTNLTLANGGRVDVASTRETGDGGLISITATEDIILFNNSPISAESSGQNDGGNISIDARFIIAFPKSARNIPFDIGTGEEVNFAVDSLSQLSNDILASAEQGQGGNIDINAKSLFGIEERPLSDSTNDINASSEFDLSGKVEIDILEVNPIRDSFDVPVATVEIELAQTCELSRDGDRSELVVTGRGGLPDSPETNISGGFVLEDWRVEDSSGAAGQSPENQPKKDVKKTEPIVEADRWLVNQQGKIVLVAASSHGEPSSLTQPVANCPVN